MKRDILYKSTRSSTDPVTASEALLRGLAPDGGLYVPTEMPLLSDLDDGGDLTAALEKLCEMDYRSLAVSVMGLLLTDFGEEELRECADKAYGSGFDDEQIAPLVKKDGMYYLELFHGRTIAFKDMALSILPHLMTAASRKLGNEKDIVILTATSGDTGKAALAAFADVPGTKIIVFYPKYGVSPVQERQMVTQRGSNVRVIGITGNFDDAQSGVKEILSDSTLAGELDAAGCRFSSANSINIGRLVPQIAYYVWAYTRLVKSGAITVGRPINVAVPTGNFGNILACYYAKKMGLPVKKLICASNKNKVLYDFFTTGAYDRNREFYVTSSPSMDILVSSNLERLIYEIAGCDPEKCRLLMRSLAKNGRYELTEEMREKLSCFEAEYADEDDTAAEIARVFSKAGYVIDPHTAVASCAARLFKERSEDMACGVTSDSPIVVVSTASPFKFTGTVLGALSRESAGDDLEAAETLARLSGRPIPRAVSELKDAQILHDTVCGKDEMRRQVTDFLKKPTC